MSIIIKNILLAVRWVSCQPPGLIGNGLFIGKVLNRRQKGRFKH